MTKPIKHVEKVIALAANAAWQVYDKLNAIHRNPSFTPKWSDKPLLKSWEKQKPKLGWPRETDSLCPKCIPEIRQQILDGTGREARHPLTFLAAALLPMSLITSGLGPIQTKPCAPHNAANSAFSERKP